jgi:histidine triad (HIT) family protein
MNTNPDCLFCKIIAGKIPSDKVYEDEYVCAFKDIAPLAPVHILIIPKEHIGGADELSQTHADLTAKLILAAVKIARDLSLAEGYRLVTNIGEHGGQTVRHLHFHLLGGTGLGGFA